MKPRSSKERGFESLRRQETNFAILILSGCGLVMYEMNGRDVNWCHLERYIVVPSCWYPTRFSCKFPSYSLEKTIFSSHFRVAILSDSGRTVFVPSESSSSGSANSSTSLDFIRPIFTCSNISARGYMLRAVPLPRLPIFTRCRLSQPESFRDHLFDHESTTITTILRVLAKLQFRQKSYPGTCSKLVSSSGSQAPHEIPA